VADVPGGSGLDLWRSPGGAPSRAASEAWTRVWIALAGAFFGCVVALAELNALYLSVALIGCIFILRDFRIGVVLLIVLLPISRSTVFPHEMLGITGLNPLNLLLLGTLAAYLLQALPDGSFRRFVPGRLLWLYIVPIVVAGVLGSQHVGEIPRSLLDKLVEYENATGYFRDVVVKPLLFVLFALLVAAAVRRSEKPEKFLAPAFISIWIMVALVLGFVLKSGVSLNVLARSEERLFLSPLGIYANELGRLYASAYALLLFTWVESKSPALRATLFVSMGPVLVALLLTFSRGSYLGFIFVNVLFLVWRRNAKTLILFALVAACGLLLLPEAVWDRVSTGLGQGADFGANTLSAGRIEHIWLPLLPEIPKSPIWGHGLSSILWSEPMRRAPGVAILAVGHPHNAYLGALLDMGVVGLVLLCSYFVHVWKGFRVLSVDPTVNPMLRGFFLGAAAGLASLLVSYTTDSSLTPGPEQSFLWLAIGMMYGHLSSRTHPAPGRSA